MPTKFRLWQVKATVKYVVDQDEVTAKPVTLESKDIQPTKPVLVWQLCQLASKGYSFKVRQQHFHFVKRNAVFVVCSTGPWNRLPEHIYEAPAVFTITDRQTVLNNMPYEWLLCISLGRNSAVVKFIHTKSSAIILSCNFAARKIRVLISSRYSGEFQRSCVFNRITLSRRTATAVHPKQQARLSLPVCAPKGGKHAGSWTPTRCPPPRMYRRRVINFRN